MDIKQIVHKIITGFLILTFIAFNFKVITFPADLFYLLVVYIAFSIGLLLYEPLLRFLTVKSVFLTQFVTTALVLTVILAVLELLIPGFLVGDLEISSTTFQVITIEPFTLNKYLTMVVLAISSALICTILDSLRKSGSNY